MLTSTIPFVPATTTTPDPAGVPGAFGTMIALYQSNARLFGELDSVRRDLSRTLTYREMPGANPVLADARLSRLRARRSAVLTHLRANRIQARALLAGLGALPECA
jgi:hypothetical protein